MRRPSMTRITRTLTTLALPGLILAGLTAPAHAQVASHEPTKVDAGTYDVEPAHTQIGFGVSHMGFTTYYGHFSGASGTLVLAPAKPADSRLDVTFPADTISTTSDKLDGELKSGQWFDVAKFPQVAFRSTQVTSLGQGVAKVTGDLTLHGVTRPVTLDVHFVGAGIDPIDKKYTVGFQATGEISRSAFGVKTYVPLIGDAVALTLSGAFEMQG